MESFRHDYFDYISYNDHIYSQREDVSSSDAFGERRSLEKRIQNHAKLPAKMSLEKGHIVERNSR